MVFTNCTSFPTIILFLICILSIYKPDMFCLLLNPIVQLSYISLVLYFVSIPRYDLTMYALILYIFAFSNYLMGRYTNVNDVKESFINEDSETTLV